METLAKLFPPVDIAEWLKAKKPVVFPIIGIKVGKIRFNCNVNSCLLTNFMRSLLGSDSPNVANIASDIQETTKNLFWLFIGSFEQVVT